MDFGISDNGFSIEFWALKLRNALGVCGMTKWRLGRLKEFWKMSSVCSLLCLLWQILLKPLFGFAERFTSLFRLLKIVPSSWAVAWSWSILWLLFSTIFHVFSECYSFICLLSLVQDLFWGVLECILQGISMFPMSRKLPRLKIINHHYTPIW